VANIEAKIDKILAGMQEIKVELAKADLHREQHRKEIDLQATDIKSLKDNQSKAFGVFSVFSVLFTAFCTWIAKHF
jgi:hypothetical protein